ncbi:MAG: HPF/RaiA family ribosome-associated protein [Candidatus Krumholzibacteria bacterium]|nr:HPF/RaiA family ribosome-associated protein [Candidatus Krumholzibacteria bacterium]
MQMEIKARHFNLGEEQRETIEAALEKLEKFSPRPVQSLNLTIDHDAGRFTADSVLHLKAHEFRANADGMEPEIAVAAMIENLRTQLSKYKGKTSGKQKGADGGLGRAMMGDLVGVGGGDDGPLAFVLKDMDIDTAKESFQSADDPFLVFRNVANSRVAVIYRLEDGGLGHMESVEG